VAEIEPATRRMLARLVAPAHQVGIDDSSPLPPDLWNALRSAAIIERVVPALAVGVVEGRLRATDDQIADAAELWLEMMRRCLRIEGRLLWLVDRLADRGVEIRVLKGSASAHLDHERPELRQFGDLDVLVRGGDMAVIFEVLCEDGFHRRFPEPRPGFDQRFTKSVSFVGEVEIDVHRTIAEGPVGNRIPVVDLWRDSVAFEVGNVEVRALAHDERFVHACLHTVLGPPPARLSSLSDVARGLVGDLVDADRVAEISSLWGVSAVVDRAVSTAITELWWPDEIDSGWSPTSSVSLLDSVMIESHRRHETSSAVRAVLSLATLPTLRDKIAYAVALALPEASYVESRHAGRAVRFRHAYRQTVGAIRGSAASRKG
jgi:hypothetical protein